MPLQRTPFYKEFLFNLTYLSDNCRRFGVSLKLVTMYRYFSSVEGEYPVIAVTSTNIYCFTNVHSITKQKNCASLFFIPIESIVVFLFGSATVIGE